ncbi:hypothetical protein [Chishuiella changwenlii]|nr:hypothetical protein [Chishuiella changwenlii]
MKKNKEDYILEIVNTNIDSMNNSHSEFYKDYLYTIAHQEKQGINYLKISTGEYYNNDSVEFIQEYKNHLLVFYKNVLFKNKHKLKHQDLYSGLAYKKDNIYMYHPSYVVIEVLNNKYRRLNYKEQKEKKLFIYNDVPDLPEPNIE